MAPPHLPRNYLIVIPHMKPQAFTISRPLAFLAALSLSLHTLVGSAAYAGELPAVGASAPIPTMVSGDFSVDGDDKEHAAERKEIEALLSNIESQWNAHDIRAVMSNYADDYYNNDGLDKKAVQKLTEDFWKTYPDAHSVSRTKEIRVDGHFATVESRDTATGTTKMKDMSSLGELQSVSEGQQYLKRLGSDWKIIGDRIDYEKVRVAFGLAKQLNATFTAPEQVKAGKLFAAKLEVNLPPGLKAVGSITNQPLVFPQKTPQEKTRSLGSMDQPDSAPVLERVMPANKDNHNELLSATVILVNPNNSLMGVSLMTRRLNVVPDQPEMKDDSTTALNQADDGDKVADSSSTSGDADKKDAPPEAKKESAKDEAKKDSKDEKPKEEKKEELKEGDKNSPPSK